MTSERFRIYFVIAIDPGRRAIVKGYDKIFMPHRSALEGEN